jgi:hypothetical protein
MRIAEKGLPWFEVVLPPRPTAAEEFAADELRRHLLAMLGLPPVTRWAHALPADRKPVALCINCRAREQAAGLNVAALAPTPESFHLAPIADDAFFIIGGGTRGTLYGVYDLLDRLGCRWFTPDVTHTPRHQDLDLPDEPVSGQPAFEYRDMLCWDITDPLWILRNRLNGHHTTLPEFMGGHDTAGFIAHSCFALVPPDQYFASHPEYYSEIDGVRRHVAGQLCLTHPDVVRIATESLVAFMGKHPEAKLFSVSQMDWEGWCECAACRRAVEEVGAQSGLYLRFVNALAERTAKEFPGKLVTTLAYSYTEEPPRVSMPLHPNVRVQLCPISTCQIHPFEACGSPQNRRFLDRIRGWSTMTDQLYIWHYATDFSHYYMPLPNLRQLHDNVRFYKQHGVRGVFMQANGFSELSDLKGYLVARLLWNPETSLETVLDEFLPVVYGAAAGEVRAYIDGLAQAAARDTAHHLGCYEPPDHPFYTEAMLDTALGQLNRAGRLARGAARRQIDLLRGGVELALLYRRYIGRAFHRRGRLFHNNPQAGDARRFRAVITARRETGNQPLSESVPLETTAERMSTWFERHALVELRTGSQRLFVAPSLGGRILEWYVGGRQLLEPPDPRNRHFQYPLSEGCAEMAIELPYGFRGSIERYAIIAQSAAAVTLAADLGDGIRAEREIRLTAEGLILHGTLTNNSPRTLLRQWGAGLHLNLGDWTKLTIDTTTGTRAFTRDPHQAEPAAVVVLARQTQPSGQWRLEFGSFALTASFPPKAVTRLILDRDDSRNRLAIDLRSETVALEPGQSLVMEQAYRFPPSERQAHRRLPLSDRP